jgi:hypothetical protein
MVLPLRYDERRPCGKLCTGGTRKFSTDPPLQSSARKFSCALCARARLREKLGTNFASLVSELPPGSNQGNDFAVPARPVQIAQAFRLSPEGRQLAKERAYDCSFRALDSTGFNAPRVQTRCWSSMILKRIEIISVLSSVAADIGPSSRRTLLSAVALLSKTYPVLIVSDLQVLMADIGSLGLLPQNPPTCHPDTSTRTAGSAARHRGGDSRFPIETERPEILHGPLPCDRIDGDANCPPAVTPARDPQPSFIRVVLWAPLSIVSWVRGPLRPS